MSTFIPTITTPLGPEPDAAGFGGRNRVRMVHGEVGVTLGGVEHFGSAEEWRATANEILSFFSATARA